MENRRVLFFDTARVLCMIWIVGVWHLSASMRHYPNLSNPICTSITVATLATFTFISAFFVSGKVETTKDIIPFYIKRLSRFYVLYSVSCFSMVIAKYLSGSESMMSIRQLLLSLVGLSTIIGPSPITLWFFSMIILFYFLTPLIDLIKNILYKVLFIIIIYFALIITIHSFSGDKRVLVFFPTYCAGLLLDKNTKLSITMGLNKPGAAAKIWLYFNVFILFISVFLYSLNYQSSYWVIYRIPIALSSPWLVLYLSMIISTKSIEKSVLFLSYISMCVYLFHSQIFWIGELIFGKMSFIQAYFITIPALLFVSWVIQRVYDCFIVFMKGKAV